MTDASGALEAREARASDVPSIAVVIPAYQAADYLRRSLAALRDAAPDVPVTVVDAGSSDDSGAVAEGLVAGG